MDTAGNGNVRTTVATAAPGADIASGGGAPTSAPSPNDTINRIKTEANGSDHQTSPAVIVLSAAGCLAAVVLVALAAYVHKKKREDKRSDRVDGVSFCEVVTPSGSLDRSVVFVDAV